MWLDSHCHLAADSFDEDRGEMLHRASLAGVDTLLAIGSGYGVQGNAEAIALAEARDEVFATAGIHPHEASELDDAVQRELHG